MRPSRERTPRTDGRAAVSAARDDRARRVPVTTFVALAVLAVALFAKTRPLPDWSPERAASPPSASPGEETPVQDFAYIFNYARRAIHRPGVSPYAIAEHRGFLSEWLGPHVGSALCFAYSPTTVLVLSPLFPLPTTWAWLAWNVVGLAVAVLAVRATAARDRRLLAIGCIGLLSPAVFYCLVLGQTALLTTGILGAMVLSSRRLDPRSWRAALPAAACVLALTVKPPLALVGAAALVAAGQWRSVVVAIVMGLPILVGAMAWWSTEIVADYRALVARYNLVEAPALIRMGFHPEVMSNLRNVLLHTGRLDDAQASRACYPPLLATLGLPALVALARRTRMPVAVTTAWASVGYALFAPHLTPAEDVLLLMVPLWLAGSMAPGAHAWLTRVCLGLQFAGTSTFALMARLGVLPAVAGNGPLVVFAAKLVVAVLAASALLRARDGGGEVRPADPA